MPPVLGPSSPSRARLKSCAGCSGRTVSPSVMANSETSGPSRYSSITTRSHAAAWSIAAWRSSVTTTPLPAASASSLTTYGGPNASSAASACSAVSHTCAIAVGTSAAAMTCLANALEPSSCAACGAGTEARDARSTYGVGDTGDQRRLRPDDDEVDAERQRERGHRSTVELVDVVERRNGGDARDCPVPRAPR